MVGEAVGSFPASECCLIMLDRLSVPSRIVAVLNGQTGNQEPITRQYRSEPRAPIINTPHQSLTE